MAEAARTNNRLLDMLPNGERIELVSRMERVPITPHDMIQPPGQSISDVYFPITGVISLMTPLEDGTAIETATVGNEGMAGIHAFLGGGILGNAQAMSQVPGEMFTIRADTFRAFVEGDGKMRDIMLGLHPGALRSDRAGCGLQRGARDPATHREMAPRDA
jgi:CRP-like cAMP-binding protein